jgi:NADH-quinone oxidoreductase subunit N
MLIGNILALTQKNVKRILAYSSIAHFGYVLMPLVSGDVIGPQAATFYVTTYIIAILAAFGLITVFSASNEEASDISDYTGLFWKKPFLSIVFTAVLLSLAGIPLTAGFMGKYFILAAGVGNTSWLLVFSLIISSVIGLFYYLRIIAAMVKQEEEKQETSRPLVYSFSGFLVLAFLATMLIWLGVLPSGLMALVNSFF